MTNKHTSKSGAALVITIGFLAILTIIIVAFTAQTRTERLAGRAYLTTAQTRHLLHTAMSRAMEDIDSSGATYPNFLTFGSQGTYTNDEYLADSIEFSSEEDFIPGPGSPIHTAFRNELNDDACWQTVTDANNKPVGRVGYIVLNTSGLLDANHVGGLVKDEDGVDFSDRTRGQSPEEIPLTSELLDEFAGAGEYDGWSLDGQGQLQSVGLSASTPSLSSALAMVYNRTNAWRHFESLRDFHGLNLQNGILNGAPINFRIFSYFPDTDKANDLPYMGSTLDDITANTAVISEALDKIGLSTENREFVLQQLRDYIDTDSIPEDPKYSVEPVPLINELVLKCNFSFTPVIDPGNEDPETGESTNEVISIAVTNDYSLNIEAWYPFAVHVNNDSYSIQIDNPKDLGGTFPEDLFGSVASNWFGEIELATTAWEHGEDPEIVPVYSAQFVSEFDSANEMLNTFTNMASDIQFPSIRCIHSDGSEIVDEVEYLELPMAQTVLGVLLPKIADLTNDLFSAQSTNDPSITFTIGRASIDPRLNWD